MRRKISGTNEIQGSFRFGLIVVVPSRIVPATTLHYLLGSESKEEYVFFSRFLADLYRRAISCANGKSAIHHEFHVAGPARFESGNGNLLGDVSRRNELLSERNIIIWQEYDFNFVVDGFVVVYDLSNIGDQFNN